ncbi:Hsp20/alpha crystallin family protein [Treponema sp. OMZ 840]|uniref:Hsp20/alpha crystallin family protein n=1 Tax=Treponema sp. OMZ 840 TaxID=244313 RepID=UPI003D8A651E
MNTLSFFNPRFTSDLFDVIDRNFSGTQSASKCSLPRVDVRETEAEYLLDMELPGSTDKDVEINLKDRILSISSAKEQKKEEKVDGEWLIKERVSSGFSRSFTLPEDIDSEKVCAGFKNGLLTVRIPRRAQVKPRTIAITAG